MTGPVVAYEEEPEEAPEEAPEGELPPTEPLCSQCSKKMQLEISRSEANCNKPYYHCAHACDEFLWADSDRVKRQLPSGPRCDCGRPSSAIRMLRSRQPMWVCAKTGGGEPCCFELPIGCTAAAAATPAAAGTAAAGTSSAAASHDEEFLVDGKTRNRLQALLEVSYADSAEFGTGADCRGQPPKGYYDYLEVERAWRILPPAATVSAYEDFRAAHSGSCEPTATRTEYAKAVRKLLKHEEATQLDESANELLLLHGTKPETVASILERSLDPGMARLGIFGQGTYFAEHACKIDQYVQVDREWKGGSRKQKYGSTCTLHNKLCPTPDRALPPTGPRSRRAPAHHTNTSPRATVSAIDSGVRVVVPLAMAGMRGPWLEGERGPGL